MNTILSSYMMKYPVGKNPKGTAKIETFDGQKFLYSKQLWIGTGKKQNTNLKYIIPGKFFEETPKKQREIIMDILNVDYAKYMSKHITNWTQDYLTRIKKETSENKGKEQVILDNIKRLMDQVITYENKPIVMVDNSSSIREAYDKWHAQQNAEYHKAVELNLAITHKKYKLETDISRLNHEYNTNENKMAELRLEFRKIAENGKCHSCQQDLPEVLKANKQNEIQILGKSLKEKNQELKEKIIHLEKELNALVYVEVPREVPYVSDIKLQAATVGIELKQTGEAEKFVAQQYEYNKKELALYQSQLKELNKIDYQSEIERVQQLNKEFTALLEQKIKDHGLDGISLFRIKADGEPTETFQIALNDKPYDELSTGTRYILNVRMAVFFSKVLGLDFIMMDEMGAVSENTWQAIQKEVEGMQFIGFKAEPFKFAKRKPRVKKEDTIKDEEI